MLDQFLEQPPAALSTMYVDMDAFFASVEQQFRPELRNRPVAVCPCLGDGCAVIASSYEAKRLGIRVGVRIAEARRRCPEIALVRDNAALYRSISRRLMAILEDTYCKVLPKSVDEACLIIPSYARRPQSIFALQKAIKGTFAHGVGDYIKCSIGVSTNMWLAKMAASSAKPNGFKLLEISDLERFYAGLPLMKLTGINYRMLRRLYAVRIYSTLDLYHAPIDFLVRHFGLVGQKWFLRMRGYEVDFEPQLKPPRSIGHQTTILGEPLVDESGVRTVLTKLASKAGRRLRQHEMVARSLMLWLGGNQYHQGVKAVARGTMRMTGDNEIILASFDLLRQYWGLWPVRRLGLTLFDLVPEGQLSIFGEQGSQAISRAGDEILDRFGNRAIGRASWLGADIVPDRVGFGKAT